MTGLVRVRASVNLAGLRRGTEALVNPDDPYIAALIKKGILVRQDDGRE